MPDLPASALPRLGGGRAGAFKNALPRLGGRQTLFAERINNMDKLSMHDKMRIVQEIVPGKQITLAHIIANPDEVLYQKLGLDTSDEDTTGAIGILTISPSETVIIAGDIAVKSSGAKLGFVDRFSGTLIVTGTVSSVEEATLSILEYCKNTLGYEVCGITKT